MAWLTFKVSSSSTPAYLSDLTQKAVACIWLESGGTHGRIRKVWLGREMGSREEGAPPEGGGLERG